MNLHVWTREKQTVSALQAAWPVAPQAREVALVERILELDATLFARHREIGRLRAHLAEPQVASEAAPLAGSTYPWMLAEDRDCDRGLYDLRVDDAVLIEADRGAVFCERHALRSDQPAYAQAVDALNAAPSPLVAAMPLVSIVIPVFGQLGHTLSCLDSLRSHVTKIPFEIIIVDDASTDGSAKHLSALRDVVLLLQPINQGFIASCNAGAGRARGDFVVFLNNDTRVVEHWLDALVDSFRLFPSAGLVGSKMLYPDGRLQEAGCIIWRDASCWNDGRNGDPNYPRYNFAREVDYVSGCSIMMPTVLFRSLGGFDVHFAPAYCEDADMAMRVREAGHEVWFQPQSRVIHDEGVTSGTDTAHGVKANQLINARKLFLRWRHRLANHRPNGQAPHLEREREARMRVAVIDANLPTPLQDAGSVTATLTLRLFRQLGYKVHFVPQDNFLFKEGAATDLMREGVEVAYAPYEPDLETYLCRHGRQFDVIMVFRVTVLEQVIGLVRQFAPQAPVLFHTMDLHHLRLERQALLSGNASELAAATTLRAKELGLVGAVDCTITHSTFERNLLSNAVPDAPVVVWPFMFPLHGTQVGFHARRDFCFLGGYGHAPNVDAVMFFVHNVLPLIHRQLPDARFIIAGANPTAEVLALAGPRVIVTGQIEDLRTVFDTVRVFACSLRVGAGTKGKISAAMSYGVPVVSTACGAEGMDLRDGMDVLLADTAEEFASACVRLHHDEALWQALSDSGQHLVRTQHSLEVGLEILRASIETAHRHHLGFAVGEPVA
jgi:GT2 family glycosyltransferase